ncbi:MAG TPA: IS5 family transposase [Ignavibacteria bacterium]
MIRYTSQNQLKFEFFKTEFETKLDINNRWVKLAEQIPWDDLANVYYKNMSEGFGSPSKSARLVIGAIIIKHKLKHSDEETIEQIKENPYLQYFVGKTEFSSTTPFDSSLFVKIRERLGKDKFDKLNQIIIEKAEEKKQKRIEIKKQIETKKGEAKKDKPKEAPKEAPFQSTSEDTLIAEAEPIIHSGKLIVDATVADQYIKYPTDIDLLNEAREKSEEIIDKMYPESKLSKKPRTYRKNAHKDYLSISKKRRKDKKDIRKAIRKQLGYLGRNIRAIEQMLDSRTEKEFPLSHKYQKLYWVIQHLYSQQLEMHKNKIHKCSDRIVSVHQPHVRPIVRGKSPNKTEFGAKLGVGLRDGYATINKLSWDAYDESADIIKQVEDYKKMYGYYPEVIIADTKYGTKQNRKELKEHGIRYSGTSLGRKPKETEENKDKLKSEKKQRKQESGTRNQIEGKFGQGKNGYNLNQIRARKIDTSESWICSIFFVMNIIRFIKDNIFVLILKIRYLVELLKNIFAFGSIYFSKINLTVLFQ